VLNPFTRRGDPYSLVVNMTGVKMGDRLACIGCAHGGRLAAIALKVGLSGRAAAVVPDEASANRARKGAADAGVLVDVDVAPSSALPLEDGSFDVAVVDDTDDRVASLSEEQRAALVRELVRVLRPGGRAVFIGAVPQSGVASLWSRAPRTPSFVATAAAATLAANGFRSARVLAEREGFIFVEGLKPR
jgi:SAM-dependent methyltransferase